MVSRSSIAPSQAENPSLMINVGRSKLLNDCINIFSEVIHFSCSFEEIFQCSSYLRQTNYSEKGNW